MASSMSRYALLMFAVLFLFGSGSVMVEYLELRSVLLKESANQVTAFPQMDGMRRSAAHTGLRAPLGHVQQAQRERQAVEAWRESLESAESEYYEYYNGGNSDVAEEEIDWMKVVHFRERVPNMFTVISGERVPFNSFYCTVLLNVATNTNGRLPAIMGRDVAFRGLFHKVEFEMEFLEGLHPYDFILFIDGKDVLVNRDLRELYDHFQTFDANLVFTMEPKCFPAGPFCSVQQENFIKANASHLPHRYINTGIVVGYAGALRHALRRMIEHTDELLEQGVIKSKYDQTGGDQYWWGKLLAVLQSEVAIAYDYNQTLAFTVNKMNATRDLIPHTEDGPDMRVRRTGVRPFFQHFNSANKGRMMAEARNMRLFQTQAPDHILYAREPISNDTFYDLCCPMRVSKDKDQRPYCPRAMVRPFHDSGESIP